MKSIKGAASRFTVVMALPMVVASAVVLATPVIAGAHVSAPATVQAFQDDGQNSQGQNNDNQGENEDNRGGGVGTPELPSGVLVAVGLLPIVLGGLLLYRRRALQTKSE